ncbi:MAG: hypothetical protein WCD35_01120 [Mycobacteriales bacterium]
MHDIPQWTARSPEQLARERAASIEAWAAAAAAAQAAASGHHSREDRRDAMLREAAHAAEQQAIESHPLVSTGKRPRAVVVHHHDWLADKMTAALEEAGIEVLTRLSDGATAVGVVVAVQPDLAVVGQTLPLRTGPDVVARLTRFTTGTLVAGLAEDDQGVVLLQRAGAQVAWNRRLPVNVIAEGLAGLLGFGKGA